MRSCRDSRDMAGHMIRFITLIPRRDHSWWPAEEGEGLLKNANDTWRGWELTLLLNHSTCVWSSMGKKGLTMALHTKHTPTDSPFRDALFNVFLHILVTYMFSEFSLFFFSFCRSSPKTRLWGSGSDRSRPVELQREPVGRTQREWPQPVCGSLWFRGQWWQHTQHHQRLGKEKINAFLSHIYKAFNEE